MRYPIHHGGNPSEIRRRFGLGDAPLLDLSTNLNPLGPPFLVLEAARRAIDHASQYPEPGCPRLTERLAEFHGVAVDRVIVGSGSTELISLIGQSLREVLAYHAQALGDPTRPLSHFADPSYGEYRRISAHNEFRAKVWGEHVLGWEQDAFPLEANGIFWTGHPDNPTGRVWDRSQLISSVDATQGLLTVVNETSLPFLADEADRSLIGSVPSRENLLILRSFSSFYAMPGLRVGYAVGPADMVTRLRQYQAPWSVSAVAEAAAIATLEQSEYREQTVDLISRESSRLVDRLWDIPGLRPAWPDRVRPRSKPPMANFVLVSLTQTDWDSVRLHEALARRGFLVRECSDFPGLEVGALVTGPDRLIATQGHLRIAVWTPEENDRLCQTLADLLATNPDH